MVKNLTNLQTLDRRDPLELVLEIFSFVGGENTIGEDQELKSNEAREIKNWDAISLGGMKRSKGFNEVADGGVTYTDAPDLLAHHFEGASTALYGVIETDLFIKTGSTIAQEDAAVFTDNVLCHAVSTNNTLWITNSTDNLRYKTIGVAIATPTNSPSAAKDRIYFHKERLIAEGGNNVIEGSRAGFGNWKAAADAWTATNDAWSATLPDDSQGMVMGFPSGPEVTVFTEFQAFSLFNFPNVALRPIQSSHGCSAPYSIASGGGGVFFLSKFPTLGVFFWDGINFLELTVNNDFIDTVNFSQRIFGIYRDNRYWLFFNEKNSGVTYPNRVRIYDADLGRWMQRPINTDLSDNFGYPALLTRDNNELYVASSQKDKVYELETTDDSDETNNTEASYKTKDFSSRDFRLANDGSLPIDDVRMKLTKFTITFSGTVGVLTIQWTADRGAHSGSQTVDLTADGDRLNIDFIVNSSKINVTPPDKTITQTFSNDAVGRRFSFQFLNSGTSTRPEVKKFKVHAVALEES